MSVGSDRVQGDLMLWWKAGPYPRWDFARAFRQDLCHAHQRSGSSGSILSTFSSRIHHLFGIVRRLMSVHRGPIQQDPQFSCRETWAAKSVGRLFKAAPSGVTAGDFIGVEFGLGSWLGADA